MTGIIHPAVLHVADCERLWCDKDQARGRAMIIVRRLVECGFLDEKEYVVRNGVVYRRGTLEETPA